MGILWQLNSRKVRSPFVLGEEVVNHTLQNVSCRDFAYDGYNVQYKRAGHFAELTPSHNTLHQINFFLSSRHGNRIPQKKKKMQLALHAIQQDKTISFRSGAVAYNVPKSTLHNRCTEMQYRCNFCAKFDETDLSGEKGDSKPHSRSQGERITHPT